MIFIERDEGFTLSRQRTSGIGRLEVGIDRTGERRVHDAAATFVSRCVALVNDGDAATRESIGPARRFSGTGRTVCNARGGVSILPTDGHVSFRRPDWSDRLELRQLRYFIRVIELGSFGRAARELDVVTSAVSQQVSRLETELSTRLLQRVAGGIRPTDAGLAFYRQAQLTLRHADEAVRAAQQARLSGHVSVGISPTTSAVLAIPFINAMRDRYPHIRLRMVESLSTALEAMLEARQIDLAVLFEAGTKRGGGDLMPLVEERLYLMGAKNMAELSHLGDSTVRMEQLVDVPLVVGSLALRKVVDAAFAHLGLKPRIAMEIDGLPLLMEVVRAGIGATIQPGAATLRLPPDSVKRLEIADPVAIRRNVLISIGENELSPPALAARVVLRDTVRSLILNGLWPGATIHE